MTIDPIFTRALVLSLQIVFALLALALACLYFKVYKTQRSNFLLGMPLGFFFLLVSSVFLVAHMICLAFTPNNALYGSLMWVRVITQTVGFGLIAASYIVAGKFQGTSARSYLIILLGTLASVLGCFGFSLLFFNGSELEAVYSYNHLFTIANLVLLSYIVIFLLRKNQLAKGNFKGALNVLLAFSLLLLGQLIFLIFLMAHAGVIVLAASQTAQIVSLAIFIYINYTVIKEVTADSYGET